MKKVKTYKLAKVHPDFMYDEREVSIIPLKYNGSPLIFNALFKNRNNTHILGLTFKEAKQLNKKLTTGLKKLLKNPNKSITKKD